MALYHILYFVVDRICCLCYIFLKEQKKENKSNADKPSKTKKVGEYYEKENFIFWLCNYLFDAF